MRRALALLSVFALVGCSNSVSGRTDRPAPPFKLVSYESCDQLLAKLRAAAKASVGPYGFGGSPVHFSDGVAPGAAEARTAGDSAAKAPTPQQGVEYSGTNVHEQGVDEPDMVKTDGKRIVVLNGDKLHVIDAASKKVTWRLPLGGRAQSMMLHGDRLLVIGHENVKPVAEPGDRRFAPQYKVRTHVELVDISGEPKVLSEFTIDGNFVDARQVSGVVRLVTRSAPIIAFPQPAVKAKPTNADRIADNRAAIEKASLDSWLPAITVDGTQKKVDCSDLNLPDVYSGASLVTLATFDLRANKLSDGDPVAVAADGNIVYGSGTSLYLAHDQRWRAWAMDTNGGDRTAKYKTDLLQFDISTSKPTYLASGNVPGWLLNQYSLSEHDGVLRAATTQSPPWRSTEKSSSAVYTLRREGGSLNPIGEVGGLGKGERIYAVRFVGKVGYVVTFRQTDPLYTIDLSNPKAPKVIGELKIPGYSAYLHPVNDSRLVGVGQDASEQGRVLGTQISLFDVGNLADPKRLDQFKVPRSSSEAEHDPHAFLYWPATKLLVVPVNRYENVSSGALLLRVEDSKLTKLTTLSQDGQIRRSLVIGDTLWTISHANAMASTLDGARELATLDL